MWHIILAALVGAGIMLLWLPIAFCLFLRNTIGVQHHGNSSENSVRRLGRK